MNSSCSFFICRQNAKQIVTSQNYMYVDLIMYLYYSERNKGKIQANKETNWYNVMHYQRQQTMG